MRIIISLDEPTHKLFERFAVIGESLARSAQSLVSSFALGASALQQIAQDFNQPIPPPPSNIAVSFQIAAVNNKEMNMALQKGKLLAFVKPGAAKAAGPIQISDSDPQAIAVFGFDKAGVPGAVLPAGASISMTAGAGANGTPGSFVQDTTPGVFSFVDSSGKLWTNIQSLASGVFTPAAAGSADVNDPFPVSYAITGGNNDTGQQLFETAVGVEASEVIGIPATPPVTPPAGS